MSKKIFAISFIVIFIIAYYLIVTSGEDTTVVKDYKITNINIYKDTPAWELALAVKNQRTGTIKKIAKDNKQLLNYQDPKYGATLLFWAVGMEKYKSAEALLKYGADPNIASEKLDGETPLYLAAGFSWIDRSGKNDPKYVKLLLHYGADPNKNYVGSEKTLSEPGRSPLMKSIGTGIDKTKALVEAGADINHKTISGYTAASFALASGVNATVERLEYAHYLIVEKKAVVSEPFYPRKAYGNEDPNKKIFPVATLRSLVYELDSDRYKMKMEIVEEFERQGVNYRETEIGKDTLEKIKKRYPDTWEEYIKKY